MSKTTTLADIVSANGTLIVPTGTTAGRPSATAGSIRFNTDLNTLESANGIAWANVGSGSASSGGGGVSWQTVQNTSFIAVTGNAYAVNTVNTTIVVTLPSSPTLGSFVQLSDYAQNFTIRPLTIYPNGNKIQSNTANITLSTSGQSVAFVYIDSTQGWLPYSVGYSVSNPYAVSYFIVGGGGSGGGDIGQNVGSGGGGAGGVLSGTFTVTPGATYSLIVGAGGSGSAGSAAAGSNSTGFSLTALGGGYGGGTSASNSGYVASSGGSGGGGYGWGGNSVPTTGGSGTVGQGNPGGTGWGPSPYGAGGGGGASSSGSPGTGPGGNGGNGTVFAPTGNYYGGGGGGGGGPGASGTGGNGGGGPGNGNASSAPGTPGTTNTGGGGGGAGSNAGGPSAGGSGGSGIILVAYPGLQRAQGGTISYANNYTIHTFTSSGTFTA